MLSGRNILAKADKVWSRAHHGFASDQIAEVIRGDLGIQEVESVH